jgi:hypothetical protein
MVANYLTGVWKKIASVDREYLLVLLLFVIVLFTSKGFALEMTSPNQISVSEKTSFLVEIDNNSNKATSLGFSVFAPVKVDVVAPNQIGPNSSVTAKVTIYNKYVDARTVNATIEAKTTDETIQKPLTIDFKPVVKSNFAEDATKVMSGLFTLGMSNGELTNFTLLDWVIFWILIIVAAVLVVAFIARVVKRGN